MQKVSAVSYATTVYHSYFLHAFTFALKNTEKAGNRFMQIKVDMSKNRGTVDANSIISELLEVYLAKLSEDSPEAFQKLAGGEIVTGLTVDIGFKLEGQSELQLLTVDPHGSDHQELLVVTAETDEAGNLVWETVKDNENDSEFTELDVLIAEGLPTGFQEIDSQYYSDQLEEIEVITVGTYQVIIYDLLTGTGKAVVQYITENRLASEIEIDLKEGQQLQDIVDHYKQLL